MPEEGVAMFGTKAIAQIIGRRHSGEEKAGRGAWANQAESGQDTHSGIFDSFDAARLVFNELRNNPEFLWEYVDDGCLARAHKMCNILTQKGFFSEKIRIENAACTWCRSYGLAVPRDSPAQQFLYIHFHIAVLVSVSNKGSICEYVFDPAFFDRPVSIADWSAKFINSDSIGADGTIDLARQEKYYSRLPWDCFDKSLFFKIKDPDLRRTNGVLATARHF